MGNSTVSHSPSISTCTYASRSRVIGSLEPFLIVKATESPPVYPPVVMVMPEISAASANLDSVWVVS